MNWQSPFSAFSPRVSSTTLDCSTSTDSSPEQKLLGTPLEGFASPGSGDSDVPLSRTHQYKKITKPLLERKRRARINKCLDELKDIMTVALQAEGENVSKLEKADILELTVRHLHKMQQGRRLFGRSPLEDIQKFQQGYSSCAQEAATFLLSSPGVDVRVSQRLLSHLSSTASQALAATLPPLSLSLSSSTRPSRSSPPASPPRAHAPAPAAPAAPVSPDPASPLSLTQGSFTLSIRRQSPEPLQERPHNTSEKAMPIKPAAIRLAAGRAESCEPVWRPYTAN